MKGMPHAPYLYLCHHEKRTKNMENFLSAIQKHFKDYPHEIVLVDTGSTDNTISIAQNTPIKSFILIGSVISVLQETFLCDVLPMIGFWCLIVMNIL